MVSSDDAVFLTVAMIYDEWLIKLYDYAQSWDGATCDILEIVVGASLDLVQVDWAHFLLFGVLPLQPPLRIKRQMWLGMTVPQQLLQSFK